VLRGIFWCTEKHVFEKSAAWNSTLAQGSPLLEASVASLTRTAMASSILLAGRVIAWSTDCMIWLSA
jgi:hypothetical protein